MLRIFVVALAFLLPGLSGAAYNASTDLISLHYDHAPDPDDGHAAVAGLIVSRHHGFTPHVVGGAYGVRNASQYNPASETVMHSAWPGAWVNAHSNWSSAVQQTVNRWIGTLAAGGDVWVAEGGQSDFTADVVRQLQQAGYNTRSRIHVVQHSQWNEDHADGSDLAFVKSNTDYIRIEDGNHPNSTADLRFERGQAFVEVARSSAYASQWNVAFNYLNPNEKVDFSDTVELLHILGIGTNQISDVDAFGRFYLQGGSTPSTTTTTTPSTPVTTTAATSGDAFVAIRVEAESADNTGGGWSLTSNNVLPNIQPDPDPSHAGSAGGNAYLELLPDTRVTHGDPLITGTNFWDTAGTGPAIDYYVSIPETGRYLVYVKAYSTGTEDNGIHVGLNNSNPASGQRIQWCDGKNQWTWSSAQRTSSNHCGTPKTIYLDITSTGLNRITFTAREDGFEFDQFLLLKEKHGGSQNCFPLGDDRVRCTDNSGNTLSDTFISLSNATSGGSTASGGSTGSSDSGSSGSGSQSSGGGAPACASAGSDSDGDGWGWENGQSCRVTTTQNDATSGGSSSASSGTNVCSSAASDSDGDGWGWENNQSCRVTSGSSGSASSSGSTSNGNPYCASASSDPDGDGWGWENNQSCVVR
jgi:hypothetical protein